MKFFVQVNIKFLVSLTADSALAAEHACLDLEGVWAAHAFDMEATKTDTFRGMLLDASTVSLEELAAMSNDLKVAQEEAHSAQAKLEASGSELDRLRAAHLQARTAFREAEDECRHKLNQVSVAQLAIGYNLKDHH